jgi:hypothetical protein
MIVRRVGSYTIEKEVDVNATAEIVASFVIQDEQYITIDNISSNNLTSGSNNVQIDITIGNPDNKDVVSGVLRLIVIDDNGDEYVIDEAIVYIAPQLTIMDFIYNLLVYYERYDNGYKINVYYNGYNVYIPTMNDKITLLITTPTEYVRLSDGSIYIFKGMNQHKIEIALQYHDKYINKVVIYVNYN